MFHLLYNNKNMGVNEQECEQTMTDTKLGQGSWHQKFKNPLFDVVSTDNNDNSSSKVHIISLYLPIDNPLSSFFRSTIIYVDKHAE